MLKNVRERKTATSNFVAKSRKLTEFFAASIVKSTNNNLLEIGQSVLLYQQKWGNRNRQSIDYNRLQFFELS